MIKPTVPCRRGCGTMVETHLDPADFHIDATCKACREKDQRERNAWLPKKLMAALEAADVALSTGERTEEVLAQVREVKEHLLLHGNPGEKRFPSYPPEVTALENPEWGDPTGPVDVIFARKEDGTIEIVSSSKTRDPASAAHTAIVSTHALNEMIDIRNRYTKLRNGERRLLEVQWRNGGVEDLDDPEGRSVDAQVIEVAPNTLVVSFDFFPNIQPREVGGYMRAWQEELSKLYPNNRFMIVDRCKHGEIRIAEILEESPFREIALDEYERVNLTYTLDRIVKGLPVGDTGDWTGQVLDRLDKFAKPEDMAPNPHPETSFEILTAARQLLRAVDQIVPVPIDKSLKDKGDALRSALHASAVSRGMVTWSDVKDLYVLMRFNGTARPLFRTHRDPNHISGKGPYTPSVSEAAIFSAEDLKGIDQRDGEIPYSLMSAIMEHEVLSADWEALLRTIWGKRDVEADLLLFGLARDVRAYKSGESLPAINTDGDWLTLEAAERYLERVEKAPKIRVKIGDVRERHSIVPGDWFPYHARAEITRLLGLEPNAPAHEMLKAARKQISRAHAKPITFPAKPFGEA